jgi:hypothetical protein
VNRDVHKKLSNSVLKAMEIKGFEARRRWDLRGLFGEQALRKALTGNHNNI